MIAPGKIDINVSLVTILYDILFVYVDAKVNVMMSEWIEFK